MSNGLVFDIKEFGLHDGRGLRTTVFLKGCPLSCVWCHNPEGQSFDKEIVRNLKNCTHCGLCARACVHDACRGFGVCTRICPNNNVKIAGEEYSPQRLAETLLKNEHFLRLGGVTFSGGEPCMQSEFIIETVKNLKGIRTAIETCGYVSEEVFARVTDSIDDIFMDIKLMDNEKHKKYTGVSNEKILKNASMLIEKKRNVTFRVPLIPGITDTDENLLEIAKFLKPGKNFIKVELIPYNRMTGAKYASVGREYKPGFDENAKPNKNTEIFENIECIAF